MSLVALVEGQLEEVFLPTLLRQLGLPQRNLRISVAGGGSTFWSKAKRFNDAAKHQQVLGLVDLEQNACVVALLRAQFPTGVHRSFGLRVAVRMLESWLLADREGFSSYLGISQSLVPRDPDQLEHPKRSVVALAQRSRRRSLREAIVPEPETGGIVGADYLRAMCDFIESDWRVDRGRASSDSLNRACTEWTALLA